MKIAYYLPSLQAPGGIERIVTFKANYFAENFHKCFGDLKKSYIFAPANKK